MRRIRGLCRTSGIVLAMLSVLGVVTSSPASAANEDTAAKKAKDIIVAFTATIETVTGPRAPNGVRPGKRITGRYTYNASTPDSNSDPTVGDYQHNSKPYGIKVDLGDFVAKTDPNNVNFLVEVVNRTDTDNYLLRSYNNVSTGPPVDHIAWQLDDPTTKALKNDSLPKKPPTLSEWQSIFGLTIEGEDFFIRAHVTQVKTM